MNPKAANRLRYAGLLAALWLLTACSQWRYDLGMPLPKSGVPEVEQHAGLSEALIALGPPQRISATRDGYVLAWEHWHIKENTLGLSLGLMGADLFSIDWGQMHAKGEFLLLTFNRQHQLTASARSEWDNHGGGQAVQPFLGLISVVDVGDLTGKMTQHRWGGSLLKPLPRALNNDSSPETGQNGVEQRGTPTAIGQRSLEMQ